MGEERRGTVKYLLTVSHAWALLLKAPSLYFSTSVLTTFKLCFVATDK